jgi:hypothetical protein
VNHSCRPNCGALKKDVGGETRVGIFALDDIPVGKELTYDYNFLAFSEERWECQCGEPTCRRFLGVSKKEVVNAIALEQLGVSSELKRNDNATTATTVGDGGLKPAAPRVRRLHHDNPLVFHDCRPHGSAGEDTSRRSSFNPLEQITSWDFDAHSTEWARHQHIFIVGSERPAPNIFDESKSRKGLGGSRKRPFRRIAPAPLAVHASATVPAWLDSITLPWHRRCVECVAAPATLADSSVQPPVSCAVVDHSSKKRKRHEVTDIPVVAFRPRVGVRRGRYAVLLRLRSDLLYLLNEGKLESNNVAMIETPHHTAAAIALKLLNLTASSGPMHDASARAALRSVGSSTSLATELGSSAALWCASEYLRGDDIDAGLVNSNGGADSNDVTCAKCYCSGNLVCCDTCPKSYHFSCAGVLPYEMPAGAWSCPACKGKRAAARRGGYSAAAAISSGCSIEQSESILRLAAIL